MVTNILTHAHLSYLIANCIRTKSMPASYKPSPLSFNSPRASPFRRPESPSSPSPLRNSTTPSASPSKALSSMSLQFDTASAATDSTERRTPRGQQPSSREPERSPTRGANTAARDDDLGTRNNSRSSADGNGLSQLQPGQVRELRECFQILDRDSDGHVGRDDIADMLTQLSLPASKSDVSPFFPPSQSQTMTLPTFLTSLSTVLSSISPQTELLSAFAAFDDDDSGQIDLGELRDALLHTVPDAGERPLSEREVDKIVGNFSGRRNFGKSAGLTKRGEVFRYQEFVNSVAGGPESNGTKEET